MNSIEHFSFVSRWISVLLPRKILVLDLDETLIHSHHDGFPRAPMVAPMSAPDFIIPVNIERNPVRFFVYKRPHVDYFLDIVKFFHSYDQLEMILCFSLS